MRGCGSLAVLAVIWSACATAAEPPDPRVQAGSLLRRAREHLAESCKMLAAGDRHAVDGYYVACQECWDAAWTAPADPEILPEAAVLYADALAGFLEAARLHGRCADGGIWIGSPTGPVLVPYRPQALPVVARDIAALEPQAQPRDRRIARRHVRDGVGLPVVVRLAPARGAAAFAATRQSLAATAMLRFSQPGGENFLETFAGPTYRDHAAAVLDLANPVEIAAVRLGPARPPLAGDLTAPLLAMLADRPRSAISGFLQPFGEPDTQPRLELLEPHQPGRVPVVFIHGLASDEGTWFDMLNELRACPEFHRRFEAWLFHYPTGAAVMQSSITLRRQLRQAVHELDPRGEDRALANMVLVGHSLGGLHAKLQVVASGDALWNAFATVPLDAMNLRPEVRDFLAERYFFEPQPFVNRVVFIATPHRGASLASRGVGRLASLTVRRPPQTQTLYDEVVGMNPGAVRPEFAGRVLSSVDLLEPDSSLLQALDRLRPPCWVSLHAIVGDAHGSLTGERDDGVVPVSSAHTVGAVSEIIVPAGHTKVHHHPDAIREVRRILRAHLRETGLDAATGTTPGPQREPSSKSI